MIVRIWRGWTTPEKSAAYEEVVKEVLASTRPLAARLRPVGWSSRVSDEAKQEPMTGPGSALSRLC